MKVSGLTLFKKKNFKSLHKTEAHSKVNQALFYFYFFFK